MSKLWKVWTQSIWLLVQADEQIKVKGRARESRNPRWQKSVRVTTANTSMIGIQVQIRPHSSQFYLKWTRLDAQIRDSGYFHWKTARNVVTRWIGTRPIRLRSGKLKSTSWWLILDVLDISAHHGSHRNFQWWVLQTSMLWQRTTWHCNTTDKKWCTGTWWRTVENESWSRSHLTWWTYALKHRGVTIIFNHDYDRIIFETRQWIWYLTIVIPIFARHFDEWTSSLQSVGDGWRECDKWRGRRSLRQCWKPEKWGSRSFSWWSTSNRRSGSSRTAWYFWWGENCKSTTYSWTADRCCENGTQHDKRSIRRLVSDLCCESWTKFSAQTSGGDQDSGYVTEIPSRLHVHSNSGREQNSAMYHILGNAQWSGDQLHVRSEKCLWRLDQRNPATLWSLWFHQSSDHSMRQRDEYHWPVQKNCTRTKRENSVTICATNKSSEQRVCRSNARTHTGTRTMLPDTNWDEHGRTTFINFTCHTICNSLRWIGSLNFHSATRRQNSISIFA